MFITQCQSFSRRHTVQRPTRRTPARVVLSEEEFRHKLSHERLVADRFHRPFSLVVFRLPAGNLRPATDPQVVGILAQRASLSADVGMLGASGLGILLRETETAVVHQFCSRIATELAEIGADVAWGVIRYPLDEAPGTPVAGQTDSYQELGASR